MAGLRISNCFCCSLLTGCVLTSLISTTLYLLAFALEVWWIVEAKVHLPVPAYLLALTYFFMWVAAASTLLGLRSRKTRLLLAWVLFLLLSFFPEAGMVLYMAVYYWKGNSYGILELSLWVLRTLAGIVGALCMQSLYTYWRDEKSVLRSLQELNATKGGFHPFGITGEYQQRPGSAMGGYRNAGYYGDNLNSVYGSTNNLKTAAPAVKRTSSAVSRNRHYVAASRLSLNEIGMYQQQQQQQQQQQLRHLSQLSLHENEFEASKFNLARHNSRSQWDLPYHALDPETGVYFGGQQRRRQQQPVSRYQVSSANHLTGKLKSGLQWYRPRSLVNLEDDNSSIWSGISPPTRNNYMGGRDGAAVPYHSLDRRKLSNANSFLLRQARSVGHLNFAHHHHGHHHDQDYLEELEDDFSNSALVHSGVGPFSIHQHQNNKNNNMNHSKMSLGQWSDHVDKYRDVAL